MSPPGQVAEVKQVFEAGSGLVVGAFTESSGFDGRQLEECAVVADEPFEVPFDDSLFGVVADVVGDVDDDVGARFEHTETFGPGAVVEHPVGVTPVQNAGVVGVQTAAERVRVRVAT
jgi:hypothetical protein